MLNLQVVSNQEPQAAREITVDQGTLLIGRDPPAEADAQVLALPDPQRVISRLHARIEYRDGRYHLTDTSTNGVFVNGSPEPLGKGNEVTLQTGDRLAIGDYRIRILSAAGEEADPSTRIFLPETTEDLPPPAEATSITSPADEVPDPSSEPSDLPEDLFAGLEAFAAPKPDTPPPEEPFDDLLRGSSLDEPFPVSPPPAEETGIPAAAPSPPESGELPVPPPFPPDRQQPPSGDGSDSLTAFLAGAGLEGRIAPQDLPEDVHRLSGSLLRILVRGLMDLLRSRAQIKNELRLDVTILGAVENNPLKFSVTVDDALFHLLKPESGYLNAEAAVREAVDDLMAHQVAVIAGMQAALKAVLGRFDPKTLERRAEKLYPLATHLPLQRQARLWTLFAQSYDEVVQELEEDFLTLFGRLFAEAYEEQSARLKRERR